MATAGRDEIEKALRELLTIARVAMPGKLYLQDPRVAKAVDLLDRLRATASGRPPSVVQVGTSANIDNLLAEASVIDAMNKAGPPVVELELDVQEALDRFVSETGRPAFYDDTIKMILREWLTANGYLPLGRLARPADRDGKPAN